MSVEQDVRMVKPSRSTAKLGCMVPQTGAETKKGAGEDVVVEGAVEAREDEEGATGEEYVRLREGRFLGLVHPVVGPVAPPGLSEEDAESLRTRRPRRLAAPPTVGALLRPVRS